MNDIQLVLTSAVVSAVVSGVLTLTGQYFERKSRETESRVARETRQRELFLTKAIDLTLDERKTLIELKKQSGGYLEPNIIAVAEHFNYLSHLFQTGQLPEELRTSLESERLEIEALEAKRREGARLHNEELVEQALRDPRAARDLLAKTKDHSLLTEDQLKKLKKCARQQFP